MVALVSLEEAPKDVYNKLSVEATILSVSGATVAYESNKPENDNLTDV